MELDIAYEWPNTYAPVGEPLPHWVRRSLHDEAEAAELRIAALRCGCLSGVPATQLKDDVEHYLRELASRLRRLARA